MSNEALNAIRHVLTNDLDEFADFLIEDYDHVYGLTEVARLPVPERRSLIAHSVSKYLDILNGQSLAELGSAIYYPHAYSSSPSSAYFSFMNCVENDSFILSHIVTFMWRKIEDDKAMEQIVQILLDTQKVYTQRNILDQLSVLLQSAEATIAEEVENERETIARHIRKKLDFESKKLQDKTQDILDQLDSASDPIRSGLAGLLCIERDLSDAAADIDELPYDLPQKELSGSQTCGEKPTEDDNPNRPYGQYFISLTKREQELAELVGQGKSNKEIAGFLSISEYTVKNHLRSIFQKLGMKNRAQLAASYAHKKAIGIGLSEAIQ